MKETAANAGKNESASLQKYTAGVSRAKRQPEAKIDPQNGLMLQRMIRGCRSSQEDLRAELAIMPFPARRSAAMSLQKSLGNRFVQGLAVQAKPETNRTGMPDQLKAGIESLSGIDISDVRVHANSDKPAQLNALAYTLGNQIHLGPGQGRHLPHEAWHVVQQKQGRVQATTQMKGLGINDDPSLEHEADMVGAKTAQFVPALDEEMLQGKFGEGMGSIVQREPEATPVKPSTQFIYHITTLENFHSIVARRGLLPLNWIIEGTHGQERDLGATAQGLDAVRGESEHESPEAHARQVQLAREYWEQNRDVSMEGALARVFADIKLGRKRDFVYGTRQSSTLANYQRHYVLDSHLEPKSLVVLRWRQHDEAYYCDLQDTDAIKALEQVDLSRLEVARGRGVEETTSAAQTYLATLPWQRADDLEGLTETCLLPPRPVVVANEEGALPADHGEAEAEDLDVLMARLDAELSAEDSEWNDELARLEAEIVLEDAEEDSQIEALDDEIAREDEEEDSLIAELESELGPEVVVAIERQVAKELLADQQDTDRMVAMALEVMRQAAPRLREAEDLEEQLRIVTEETDEQIRLQETISERLAEPLQMRSPARGSNVIQYMLQGARSALETLLEDLGEDDPEKLAHALEDLPGFKDLTLKQIMSLAQKVDTDSSLKDQLAKQMQLDAQAFAAALLGQIGPEQEPEQDGPPVTVDFEKLIQAAVEMHAPLLGARIDAAQERARKSGKKLLVIVGEKHDDIYARVMVTVLVGAMQRISIHRLYLETTPDALHEYVDSYRNREPDPDLSGEFKARGHFFRSLYQLGTTLEGVDVQKETATCEVKKRQDDEPSTDPDRSKWRANFWEQNVAARNTGMAKALATRSESGVLLVGLSHLPGLASDPVIQNAYEIVTVAASLPSEGIGRDYLAFGRVLAHTDALKCMTDLYVGGSDAEIGEVDPRKAFALAKQMTFDHEVL